MTRLVGAATSSAPPPDVTQQTTTSNGQKLSTGGAAGAGAAIQILSDGTFYKTMLLDANGVPAASVCSGSSPVTAVSSSCGGVGGGYRPLPPTDMMSGSDLNRRGSPTRCSSAGLYR